MHPHRIMQLPPYWTESTVWSCFISTACLFVRVLRALVLILFVGKKKKTDWISRNSCSGEKKKAPSHQRSLLFAMPILKRNAFISAITVSDFFPPFFANHATSLSLQLCILRTPTVLGDGEMRLGAGSVRCCSGTFEELLWLNPQNLHSGDRELHISSFSLPSLCLLCFVGEKNVVYYFTLTVWRDKGANCSYLPKLDGRVCAVHVAAASDAVTEHVVLK